MSGPHGSPVLANCAHTEGAVTDEPHEPLKQASDAMQGSPGAVPQTPQTSEEP
jgi:hypothetical protein